MPPSRSCLLAPCTHLAHHVKRLSRRARRALLHRILHQKESDLRGVREEGRRGTGEVRSYALLHCVLCQENKPACIVWGQRVWSSSAVWRGAGRRGEHAAGGRPGVSPAALPHTQAVAVPPTSCVRYDW